jgi:hypothetical protein
MKVKLFALVMMAGLCLPAFSEDEPIVFDTSAAFSWYPFPDFAIDGAALEPDDFNYNLQLSMGVKLFSKVSTYLDIDVDDLTMKKMVDIAGSIGSKYFGVQFDYHRISGNLTWDEYWLEGKDTFHFFSMGGIPDVKERIDGNNLVPVGVPDRDPHGL